MKVGDLVKHRGHEQIGVVSREQGSGIHFVVHWDSGHISTSVMSWEVEVIK